MCGIAGLIHRGKSSNVGSELQGMLQALKHRGEDSTESAMIRSLNCLRVHHDSKTKKVQQHRQLQAQTV